MKTKSRRIYVYGCIYYVCIYCKLILLDIHVLCYRIRVAATSVLIAGVEDDLAQGMAQRLAKKLKIMVFVSSQLTLDENGVRDMVNFEKKIVEMIQGSVNKQ